MKIRKAVVAGQFYPADRRELSEKIDGYFRGVREFGDFESKKGKLRALVVPHAGYIYSGQVAAYGYKLLHTKRSLTNHFVLVGPSHHYDFGWVVCSEADYWETPLGKVRHIIQPRFITQAEEPFQQEHSLETQLPFLQYLFGDSLTITCLLTGRLKADDSARIADRFLAERQKGIYIFSTDLSHYLPYKTAAEKDRRTIKALVELDFDYFNREENVACGSEGLKWLIAMARQAGWRGELLAYDTSATTSDDKSAVVGYAAMGFFGEGMASF